jgi:hypothetical protein
VIGLDYRRARGASGAVRGIAFARTGRAVAGAWVPLAPGTHRVGLTWVAKAGGGLLLSIDGAGASRLAWSAGWRSHIESVRLGAVGNMRPAARGILDLDAFASRRVSAIGG